MMYKPTSPEIQSIASLVRLVATFVEKLLERGLPPEQIIEQLRMLADDGLWQAAAVDLDACKNQIVDDIDLGFDNVDGEIGDLEEYDEIGEDCDSAGKLSQHLRPEEVLPSFDDLNGRSQCQMELFRLIRSYGNAVWDFTTEAQRDSEAFEFEAVMEAGDSEKFALQELLTYLLGRPPSNVELEQCTVG